MTGATGTVPGLNWDEEAHAAIAEALGYVNGGVSGCCAASAWYTEATNTLHTHNYGEFNNYSCLLSDFPLHACAP